MKWGFAQVDQQWFDTPALLADAEHMYAEVKPLQPNYWRIGAQWWTIAKQKDPGTFVAGTPPTTTGRNWSTLDTALNEGLLLGAEIVLILGVLRASWGGFQFGPFSFGGTPGSNADFGVWCAETVTRYKPGGVGIRTDGRYAANAGKGVRIFEIWNEQNDQGHDGGQISAKDYTDRLIHAYTAIKGVSGMSGTPSPGTSPGLGQSLVLFGGTYHVQRQPYWSGYGIASLPEIDYLTQCYTYGAKDHFDAMAVHNYTYLDDLSFNGSDIGPVPTMNLDGMKQLVEIHGLMVAQGDGAKHVWVTEAGFPVSIVTEAQQKSYWETLWAQFASLSYVEAVLFYCARDGGGAVTSANGSLGAMRADFTHRPVWDFLQTLAPTPVARATAVLKVPKLTFSVTPTPAIATATLKTPIVVEPIIRPSLMLASAMTPAPGLQFPLIAAPSAAASAAMSVPAVKVTYTVAIPTSALPTGWSTKYGDTVNVASNIMLESNHAGADGSYRTLAGNTLPTNTTLQFCKCVMASYPSGADRGQGPAVAFDSAYNNGVFAIGTGFTFADGGIYSKIGAAITREVAWTGNVLPTDALEVRMSLSGGHVVYTLYLNNSSTGISWTDSTNKITPGMYCGVAFQHRVSGGAQYSSMGIAGPITYGDM